MQFIPGTWADVGYDANGDGKADPCHYEDAIYSAAKYLNLSGAPGDYQAALFQYNNAQWYVDEVLARAEEYRAAKSDGSGKDKDSVSSPALIPSMPSLFEVGFPALMSPAYAQESPDSGSEDGGGTEPGIVAPVDSEHMDNYENDWGDSRPGFTGGFHDGTDITGPRGAPIYSMVDGTVQQEANSSETMYQEVGGYNLAIEATESVGPVEKGDWLSYAHMDSSPSVRPGDTVTAGQVIGEVGDTGYGPEVTRGEFGAHLHVGWYDMTGGERAEHSTGAINPYPLLEYIKDNGGKVSGDKADDVAPSSRPTSSESPSGGAK
jgi:murein DD-endopeptidase MepM/ murein hydrolase activator NlpD